jgi:hypothetical protein
MKETLKEIFEIAVTIAAVLLGMAFVGAALAVFFEAVKFLGHSLHIGS